MLMLALLVALLCCSRCSHPCPTLLLTPALSPTPAITLPTPYTLSTTYTHTPLRMAAEWVKRSTISYGGFPCTPFTNCNSGAALLAWSLLSSSHLLSPPRHHLSSPLLHLLFSVSAKTGLQHMEDGQALPMLAEVHRQRREVPIKPCRPATLIAPLTSLPLTSPLLLSPCVESAGWLRPVSFWRTCPASSSART